MYPITFNFAESGPILHVERRVAPSAGVDTITLQNDVRDSKEDAKLTRVPLFGGL